MLLYKTRNYGNYYYRRENFKIIPTLILVPPLGSQSIFYWYLYGIVFQRLLEGLRIKNKKIKYLALFKKYRVTYL